MMSFVACCIWATQQLRSYLVKGFALVANAWRGAVLLR
jgi:hypothetical protein